MERFKDFVVIDDEPGCLNICGLFGLFDLYGISIDAGIYICDPTDPDKRYIIKRVQEAEGRGK